MDEAQYLDIFVLISVICFICSLDVWKYSDKLANSQDRNILFIALYCLSRQIVAGKVTVQLPCVPGVQGDKSVAMAGTEPGDIIDQVRTNDAVFGTREEYCSWSTGEYNMVCHS